MHSSLSTEQSIFLAVFSTSPQGQIVTNSSLQIGALLQFWSWKCLSEYLEKEEKKNFCYRE